MRFWGGNVGINHNTLHRTKFSSKQLVPVVGSFFSCLFIFIFYAKQETALFFLHYRSCRINKLFIIRDLRIESKSFSCSPATGLEISSREGHPGWLRAPFSAVLFHTSAVCLTASSSCRVGFGVGEREGERQEKSYFCVL